MACLRSHSTASMLTQPGWVWGMQEKDNVKLGLQAYFISIHTYSIPLMVANGILGGRHLWYDAIGEHPPQSKSAHHPLQTPLLIHLSDPLLRGVSFPMGGARLA